MIPDPSLGQREVSSKAGNSRLKDTLWIDPGFKMDCQSMVDVR